MNPGNPWLLEVVSNVGFLGIYLSKEPKCWFKDRAGGFLGDCFGKIISKLEKWMDNNMEDNTETESVWC